ncbi:MAG: TetR/AcrR family transcriptional regulator [Sciscionella sp.]
MTTPKGERRRQQLIEAAALLLAEGGFDAVRHRAVAERAGLPLASTTYYFDSLDELITATVEHSSRADLAAGRAVLEGLDSGAQGVGTVVEVMLERLLGSPKEEDDFHAVLLRYEQLVATGRRPYLRPLMRRLGAEFDALLGEILTHCGMPLPPAEVKRLVALVDGTVVSALLEVDPDPRSAARRALAGELARQVNRTRGSSTA